MLKSVTPSKHFSVNAQIKACPRRQSRIYSTSSSSSPSSSPSSSLEHQKGTTQLGAAVARGAAHGLSRPQQPAVCKAGAKKARAREAPDCPGSPTSDQKRALGGSRNLQSSPTVRMDDFQSLQDFCASLLRASWQASADLHVSWNTATTGQYDSTGYGDIGWGPSSWLVSFLVW